MEVIEHLQDNPLIVVNGFKHAGINQALGILIDESDLSIYPNDSYEYSDDPYEYSESLDKDGLPDDSFFSLRILFLPYETLDYTGFPTRLAQDLKNTFCTQ